MARSFELCAFTDFDPVTLYAVLAARGQAFVVEQRCAYLDADGKDVASQHLLLREAGQLIAYLRIVPPGLSFPEHGIGRVLTVAHARGRGHGRALVLEALQRIEANHGKVGVCLSAQVQLLGWYESMGFTPIGDIYEDAGIRHVDMRRPP